VDDSGADDTDSRMTGGTPLRLQLEDLADAFASSKRHDIYRHLSTCSGALSAGEVAERFVLTRTAARAHLEKLSDLGLVEVITMRRHQCGRPAKGYAVSDTRVELVLPSRRYEFLAQQLLALLGETLEPGVAASQAAVMGLALGEQTAMEIAGDGMEAPVKLSVPFLVEWMDASGYEVRVLGSDPTAAVIEVRNCVYRELALEHPELVCSFDRGMLCGMLGVSLAAHTQTLAMSAGDPCCRHEFRL
jgi:predicted ArsR family transcriptional regulator